LIYNNNIGELYDTLYFGVIYFNKEFLQKKATFKTEGHEILFEFYDEIKDEVEAISPYLTPFYYCDGEYIPFIVEFFTMHLDIFTHNFNDYIRLIEDDSKFKPLLYKQLLHYPKEEDLEKIIKNKDVKLMLDSIGTLNYSVDLQYQTMFVLTNVDYTRELLKNSLLKIYKVIQKLHLKQSKILKSEFKLSKQKEAIQLYHEMWKIEIAQIHEAQISYSLLNRYIYYVDQKLDKSDVLMLLGIKHRANLDYKATCNKKDIKSILNVFSDPLRVDIMETLLKHEELTLSQLARQLFASTTTIQRHLHILITSRIIIISKQENIQIYYSLNKSYIKCIHKAIDDYLDRFTSK